MTRGAVTDETIRPPAGAARKGGTHDALPSAADGAIRKQVGNATVLDPLRMMEELSAMLRRLKLPLDNKHEHIRKTVGQPR